ncbi:5-methyltetrahydrofolate--homocysteine methyltransferase [Thermanaeromonas toyohensis ToBE]|uniref:5-methyltetrahydrofolate--homocysteine methyltransferase n=1 Tax=Thermanaeromonas toyohensis ToBE TaxID=698762 RepID=A0A1W1W166_9FIRM|nr:corrinoid protein [Thermanaeromonas toyohensis]SMB99338.1 5-methyltetrahydrofolate--homocysteine methyltransferase [Thermanaeromonas toyohensis ToBE]
MTVIKELAQCVISGNIQKVEELTRKALDEGIPPLEVINQGLIAGMSEVGAKFKAGEMFVPEVLMSARAMNTGLSLVKPLIVEGELKPAGTVVLGTVKGDLHDIGKNLVGMMLEGAGFKVIDLGIDVEPSKFVTTALENKADIIGMSALLTTTMLVMKDVIELLKREGVREKFKVMVGGAPVTQDFADEIGADGYAPDAASATDLAKRLVAQLTGSCVA